MLAVGVRPKIFKLKLLQAKLVTISPELQAKQAERPVNIVELRANPSEQRGNITDQCGNITDQCAILAER